MTKIAFIGSGQMAAALIARLNSPHKIIIADLNQKRLRALKQKYRVKVAKNNVEAFAAGQIVVLAVKPQHMAEVLQELGAGNGRWGRTKLIISIAAGIPLSYLQKKLPGLAIIRAMPNNPCLVGQGMTALARGKKVTAAQLRKAKAIFEKAGKVVEIKENQMDAVTGLAGSGPAFVYQAIEALINGGVEAGLPASLSARFALQTVYGASKTAVKADKSPRELREMVSSPGGTTIEGLKALKKRGFSRALQEAVVAAAQKSKVLSKKWTS